MKYYVIIILSALFLGLMLCACTKTDTEKDTFEELTDEIPPEEEKMAMVTRELIMEKFGITEYDLKGIDVEFVLQHNPYTETHFNSITSKEGMISSLRNRQKEALETLETEKWLAENSLSYLLEGFPCQGELPATETLK